MTTRSSSQSRSTSKLDTSLSKKPLAGIRDELEVLHITLDNFVVGKTTSLHGNQTRNRVNHALQELDSHLAELDGVLAVGFPSLKGRVTQEMIATIKQAQEHQETLHNLLYDSLQSAEKLSRTQRGYVRAFLDLLRYDLGELLRQTE